MENYEQMGNYEQPASSIHILKTAPTAGKVNINTYACYQEGRCGVWCNGAE